MLAFLVIAGFPALAAFFGWFELRDVANTQTRLYTSTLPELSDMCGFTEESARIVAAAPEFAAVEDEAERARFLKAQVAALSARLERFSPVGGPAAETLRRAVAEVGRSIEVLDRVVQERIALTQGLVAVARHRPVSHNRVVVDG